MSFRSGRGARIFKAVLACGTLALVAGCKHDWRHAEEFAAGVRCGMSEADVLELAKRLGVEEPQAVAERRFPGQPLLTIIPGELDFVDILFENERAVAVQRGNYVSFTTDMDFGRIRMLCGDPLPGVELLRDVH